MILLFTSGSALGPALGAGLGAGLGVPLGLALLSNQTGLVLAAPAPAHNDNCSNNYYDSNNIFFLCKHATDVHNISKYS